MPDPSRPAGGSRLPALEGRERRATDGEARAPGVDGRSLRETPSLQLLESLPDAVVVVDGDGPHLDPPAAVEGGIPPELAMPS